MSNIIILGDVHLGGSLSIGKSGNGSSPNSRVVDQINLLNWTIDQALETNSKRIVITGDVFEDPKPSIDIISSFISWLNKCKTHNISVDIIMGNHDMLRTGNTYISALDIITECEIEGCNVYKNMETIYVNNTAITFLPFRDRKSFFVESNAEAIKILEDSIEYEQQSIPPNYKKVMIGHLAIEGSLFVGDEIDDLMNELFITPKSVTGYDFVWMGHIHRPQVLHKNPLIAHVGSMDVSDFGEIDHKKYLIVFDTKLHSYSEIEIPTRALKKLVISVPKGTEDTTKYVLDEIKNKKIDFSQSTIKLEIALMDSEIKPMNRGEVESFLYKEGAFNITKISETKKLSLVKKQSSDGELTTNLNTSEAIKTWANVKWSSEQDIDKKNKFIEMAIEIYKELKS